MTTQEHHLLTAQSHLAKAVQALEKAKAIALRDRAYVLTNDVLHALGQANPAVQAAPATVEV